MGALFIRQYELDVKKNLRHIFPINHYPLAFLTYSQVELILCLQGFTTQSLNLVDLLGEVQPEKRGRKNSAFSFQAAMKNKDIFSQDNKVIDTTPSHFRFLEEMNVQVSFYERSSFSQLFACCYVPSETNACINWGGL